MQVPKLPSALHVSNVHQFPLWAYPLDLLPQPHSMPEQGWVLCAGSISRQVLHVQSISSWAPSCIGPYSQATMLGGLVHMAGQIGLDPATMQLVAGGLQAQLLRYSKQPCLSLCFMCCVMCCLHRVMCCSLWDVLAAV